MRTESGIGFERLDLLDADVVSAYLLSRRWTQTRYPGNSVRVFCAPAEIGAGLSVLVPTTRDLRDFRQMLDHLIVVLAEVEERPYEEIYHLLRSLEILKVRAEAASTTRGTIPLGKGDALFECVRNLITYSACSELAQQKYFARSLKPARELADQYELGQTEPGSFVLNIIVPRGDQLRDESGRLLDVQALPHRVVQRILRGTEAIRQAVLHNAPGPIVDAYRVGFNANMCDIVAKAMENAELDALSFTSVGATDDADSRSGVSQTIPREALPQIGEASVILKEAPVQQSVHVIGKIVQLRNLEAGGERDLRQIQVFWAEKGYRVILWLSESDYALACDAHRDHKRVMVDGILYESGRRFYLSDCSGFGPEASDRADDPGLF